MSAIKWDGIATALKKKFKYDGVAGAHVKTWLKTTSGKHKAVKGAYAKVGKIGDQYIFRIKTSGLLKSTHLEDKVLIDSIKITKLLTACASTQYKIVMLDKSIRDTFRAYLHCKYGLSANELAFWEVAANPSHDAKIKKKIYELYVKSSGKHQVNLSSGNKKALDKIAKTEKYEDLDFTDARIDVYKMLKGKFSQFQTRLNSECCNKFWPEKL